MPTHFLTSSTPQSSHIGGPTVGYFRTIARR